MNAQHTATPLQVWTNDDHYSDDDSVYIAGNPTGAIGGMRKLALIVGNNPLETAKFIVHACNAHSDLVKAVRAESAVQDMPLLKSEKVLKELGWDGERDINAFVNSLRRAALAKAGAA